MKALLLIEDDAKAREVEARLGPLGFSCVRYRNPLKALDNLEEIAPDTIVASALDFPRHWKIIADVVRAARSRNECLIILLRGEHFDAEEADKAAFLGVNGIVSENLAEPAEQARLLRLLRRYTVITDPRVDERLPAASWDRIAFLFSQPLTTRILGGRVLTISIGGLSLAFPETAVHPNLVRGALLEDCSLRIGDEILSPVCTIARRDSSLGLSFKDLGREDRSRLEKYLAGRLEREIHARAHDDVDKSGTIVYS